ncbi:MAG: fluoride efflux transporter CrcB [Rhodobacterales bacterium]|nr:MAG: fluoride efflux transporter CrcB [Rhodobacterales bacterium]
MLMNLLQVALGGALGAMARYLTTTSVTRLIGHGFPLGTMVANVLGGLAMGALVVILAHRQATHFAPFLITGLLGGFTTFSAFSLDAVTLFERGQTGAAALYVGASVGLSIAALWAGMYLTRMGFSA